MSLARRAGGQLELNSRPHYRSLGEAAGPAGTGYRGAPAGGG